MKKLLTNLRVVTPDTVLQNASILWEDGIARQLITGPLPPELKNLPPLDGRGLLALPGLVDLHIHGSYGFGPETENPADLLALSDALFKEGVAAFCPTLYAAPAEKMKKQLEKLAPVIGQEKGAKIIGLHLEGPFISPQKPGVMHPQDMTAPDVEIFKQLYQAAQGKIAAVTLAPELKNIKPIADFCRAHAILMQAGHTNATYEQMQQAKKAGIKHLTHFGNAMSPFHHRAPGALGAALMDDDFSCEVIADGVHVAPEVVRFLLRIKPAGQVIFVTDALRPTGQQTPPFLANNEEVFLQDHVWKRKTDHVLAGSALTMLEAVKNAVAWGVPLAYAVRCATQNPARLMGLKGALEEGYSGPILLVDEGLKLKQIII